MSRKQLPHLPKRAFAITLGRLWCGIEAILGIQGWYMTQVGIKIIPSLRTTGRRKKEAGSGKREEERGKRDEGRGRRDEG